MIKSRKQNQLTKSLLMLSFSAISLLSLFPGEVLARSANPTGKIGETNPIGELSTIEPNPVVVAQETVAANPKQATHLVLNLSRRRVYVHQDDKVIANYPVAIGRTGWETPTGNFKVLDMQKNPSWIHPFNGTVVAPGRNNPLGLRWIGFWTDGNNFIGFHGTPPHQENLIGQAVSHGCVRMRNRDIEALYEKVSMDIPVIVQR